MNLTESWKTLSGAWTATNGFRFMPADEFGTTPATLDVRPGPGPSALTILYTWQHEGAEQQGVLVIAAGDGDQSVKGVWLDSFHQQPGWMDLAGTADVGGIVHLAGSYPDDPGEPWGWRITLDPTEGSPVVVMDNVPPGEEPYPVVRLTAQPR